MRYEDFVASAIAAGPELGAAGARPLGETILAAVHATRRWTAANTNLGIILLFAPIAAAQELGEVAGRPGLRRRLGQILRQTTVDDAIRVYAAIREAGPGGMGTSAEQDLSAAPTVTLVEAMRLAAERDLVAREYTTDFALTFECGLPALRGARVSGLAWPDAIVETFLTLLAQEPDTLIARKLGRDVAESISFRAAQLLRTGGPRSPHGREAIAAFDAELRDAQNSRNPGTTADLTAAALFVSLIEDGWDTDRSRTARAQ